MAVFMDGNGLRAVGAIRALEAALRRPVLTWNRQDELYHRAGRLPPRVWLLRSDAVRSCVSPRALHAPEWVERSDGREKAVDTVGRRFSQAFAAVGLTPVASRRLGDTVLVRGGPTELGGAHLRGIYASRMVPYKHGDSTRFRWYWSITPLAGRWATASKSASVTSRGIEFCGEIGKVVAIKGWSPREPNAEDSITVWKRLP